MKYILYYEVLIQKPINKLIESEAGNFETIIEFEEIIEQRHLEVESEKEKDEYVTYINEVYTNNNLRIEETLSEYQSEKAYNEYFEKYVKRELVNQFLAEQSENGLEISGTLKEQNNLKQSILKLNEQFSKNKI